MKRFGRFMGVFLLSCVGGIAFLVGATFTVLRTDAGGDFVRRLALPRVNARIAGHLEIDHFAFGGDRVTLDGIVLRGPGGDVIAGIRRLELVFSPLAVLRGHLFVRRGEIVGPFLLLRQEGTQMNLARALGPKHPPPAAAMDAPKAPGSSNGLTVDIAALRVLDGLVEVRSPAETAPPVLGLPARIADISIQAQAHLDSRSRAFEVDVRVNALVRQPLEAPLTLRVTGHGHGAQRDIAMKVTVGEGRVEEAGAKRTDGDGTAEVVIDGTLHTDGPTQGTVRLARVRVTPRFVRALLPAVALRVPLELTATAIRAGAIVTVVTSVDSAAGAIDVRGTTDPDLKGARQIVVNVKNLDLGRLVEGLPRSDLSLVAEGEGEGEGGGGDATTLTGKLALRMPVGVLAGASVGPVLVRLNATRGHYQLRELHLAAPGITVDGQGQIASAQVALRFAIVASDLARASRMLSSFRGLRAPALAGHGRLDLSLFGTTAAPGAATTALFPRLDVANNSVAGLKISARVPDLLVPQFATAAISAASAHVAGHRWRDVQVQVQSAAHGVNIAAHAAGTPRLSVRALGKWGPGREWLDLHALELRYPEAAWTLDRPTRLTLEPDHLAVGNLQMHAREQRIVADVDKRGPRIRARVILQHIDLGRVPRQALPAGVVLGGLLDVHAEVGGTTGRPTGQATINLREGRWGHYRDLGLRLDGRFAGGRVSGNIDAQGLQTLLRARFDLPTTWPSHGRPAPLALDVTLPEVDLSVLRGALGLSVLPRLSGKMDLSVQVQGTESEPDVHLAVNARRLVVDEQPLGDISVRLSGNQATPLTAAVEFHAGEVPPAKALASAGAFDVRTDLSLATLVRRPPTVAELMHTHFDVSGQLRGISLGALAGVAHSSLLTGGTASVRLSATGTAAAPAGALNVQVAGATGPHVPSTDGRLDAAFGQKDTRVALRVARGNHELLSASGILSLPSRKLGDRALLVTAPLTCTAAVGPLRFLRNELSDATPLGIPDMLSGRAGAALSIAGTLARPTMKLTADIFDVRLGTRPLGVARALITYATQRADVEAHFRVVNGGDLKLAGHGAVDLGYASIARGLNIGQIPLEASFTARNFDLAWLSGLSRDVRTVGGQLSALIAARGRVGQPAVNGQLEWANGALTLTGLGSYRNVHLKAHGDQRSYWLDELSLASGEGNARLSASAVASGNQSYQVTSSMALRRFPIYSQGEALAVLSIDDRLTGSVSPQGARASVKISEAHVELTDAKRKDLQPLGVPADVVFMDAGKPVDRAQAIKLAALTEKAGIGSTAGASVRELQRAEPAAKPFVAQVGVDAPRNLWVHGKDAALELGLGSGFRVEAAGRLRVYGRVLVRRGRIDVLGRRFDLQSDSVLQFIGLPDAPRVDVTAKYVNEAENITVMLTAKGALDHLAIAVSSPDRPDLTEGQIYTLIVTGHLQLGGNAAGSTSASDEAASLVGGLVAAQLQKTLAKRLPLDVLTLQAGEGLSGSRLEAGTYLTSKLYAGYVGRVGATALLQNRNALHLEYELSRRWSFDGEYGDVGTGTADLVWTKHY